MIPPRKPASFRITDETPRREPITETVESPTALTRQPRAMRAGEAVVVPAETDYFAEAEADLPPIPINPTRRRSKLASIFFAALGALVSLALGLWVDGLIRTLFARNEWLGWAAAAIAAIAAVSLVVLVGREMRSLWRLASIEKLRRDANDAMARDDAVAARSVVDQLTALVAADPDTAAGRRALKNLDGEIIDGAGLIRLAEIEILAPLDLRARALVLDAAKRVSIVTTVSPRALVDLAYVVFEASRLIRRLAELYGARPGTLGFFRLARSVIAHLAVTGAIAAGDDFIHQVVGQGLAARLSAKLGEGIVNGMMTARIGIAAMETVRPLPFSALKRPKMTDVLSVLTSMAREKSGAAKPPKG